MPCIPREATLGNGSSPAGAATREARLSSRSLGGDAASEATTAAADSRLGWHRPGRCGRGWWQIALLRS